jgi:hypothetical protein
MPKPAANEKDDNAELARAVTELTDSEPLKAEECFDSLELQRQFREAKEREKLRANPVRE